MKLKKYRMPLLICISIIAITAVVKFSGFDEWLKSSTGESCRSKGMCASRLNDREK